MFDVCLDVHSTVTSFIESCHLLVHSYSAFSPLYELLLLLFKKYILTNMAKSHESGI